MATTQKDKIAELQLANAELRQERDAALAERNSAFTDQVEYQAATSDVLRMMSSSTSDTGPVFDIILRHAMHLCNCEFGGLQEFDGELVHLRATRGFAPDALAVYAREFPKVPTSADFANRAILSRETVHIRNVDKELSRLQSTRGLGHKSNLAVPLLRDGAAIGAISLGHVDVNGFTDAHVELLKTFAEQAVIAIGSAATFRALQTRTSELQESLEYQTATSDVLKVISRSTFDLQPVLDTVVETAARLCEADQAAIARRDGEIWRFAANCGFPPEYEAYYRARGAASYHSDSPSVAARTALEGRPVHIHDVAAVPGYPEIPIRLGKQRTSLGVPMLREGVPIGVLLLARQRVEPFTDRQIELVSTFADQAVIAIENARLITEQREALEQQTATAEVLQAINANPGNLTPVFDAMLEKAHALCGAVLGALVLYDGTHFRAVATLGYPQQFGEVVRQAQLPSIRTQRLMSGERFVHVLDMKKDSVGLDHTVTRRFGGTEIRTALWMPLRKDSIFLGFISAYRREVQAFSDKQIALLEYFAAQAVIAMENARLIDEIRAARDAAEDASRTIEAAFRDLKAAQANLIQAEKMASLGQLTAGIAHEIKNPLNFVNNFAALSVDLLSELKETAAPGFAALTDDQRAEIDDVSAMLTSNLEKITEHGKRADGIVKAMLEHSRGSSVERRMVDLNSLIDEALNLAYHGARAQDQSFNITLERDFTEGVAPIEVNPQDMTRVFLNIFSNGFYAATRRARSGEDGFVPTLKVTTRDAGEVVEIRVRDNGTGIPAEIRDKLFQPFFTTKPTGEGTGLGLSITYDIVTKQHGGTIAVESEVGEFTEFVVTLPRQMFATEGDRA